MPDVFVDLARLLAISTVAGGLALLLRQPLLVAFLGVGILVGPAALGWVTARSGLDLFAQIGVTMLLFVVGLKLDLHLVRRLGKVALATGIGQIVFTSVIGLGLAMALGMNRITALYVAVALTFSSTIIIVKLLSDKKEIDSLHGRISMGFLIVQDIAVVLAMVLLSPSTTGGSAGTGRVLVILAVKLLGTVFLMGVLMRWVLPRLVHHLARSMDLLVIFAITWGVALSALSEAAGFSREIGAFLAGFSLASTRYREAISARLTALRDFLLLFFFIELGARLDLSSLGAQLPAAGVLSVFVLIGNPLIVMVIMGVMGYRKHTGFLCGLTVAQISEFSIVFTSLGVSRGHIAAEALGLVTLVGLVTITLSTYMILYSQPLYKVLSRWLGPFERRLPRGEQEAADREGGDAEADVIVLGLGRYGQRMAEQLAAQGLRVLGVDFDPAVVYKAREVPILFGDAEDPDFLTSLPLRRARWVVSTLPLVDLNIGLLQALREHGFQGGIALTARFEEDARRLRGSGADRVLLPFLDAADYAARLIAQELARSTAAASPPTEPRAEPAAAP